MAKYTWYMDAEKTKPRHWENYWRYLGVPTPRWLDRHARWVIGWLRVCGLVRARKHPADLYYDR